MLDIRTILHPTDFSDSSDHAFRLACALARDYDARLVVVHVGREPVLNPVEGVVPPEPERYRAELMEQLRRRRAEGLKVRTAHQLVFGGDPAAEIVEQAQQTKSDLIVMGTHGRTGLGRLLLGSVTEQVVRRAPCPVLTVKTPLPLAHPPGESAPEMAGRAMAETTT
jgi:nucleotide-binding universal stress UspA family protein